MRQCPFFSQRVEPAVNRNKSYLVNQAIRAYIFETLVQLICFAVKFSLSSASLFAHIAQLSLWVCQSVDVFKVDIDLIRRLRLDRVVLIVFWCFKILVYQLNVKLINVIFAVICI